MCPIHNSFRPEKDLFPHDRRKHPRFVVGLPMDYSRVDGDENYGGVIANASKGGILVFLPERLEVGDMLRIEIFFTADLELDRIKAIAKVAWYDLVSKEGWAEHRHGLQFKSIYKGDLPKLDILLKDVAKLKINNVDKQQKPTQSPL